MPYIKPVLRPAANKIVEMMIRHDIRPDGQLNYVLYKFCKDTVEPSYNNYKNFLGELNECAEEIRRTILAPYEDEKKSENGDVV